MARGLLGIVASAWLLATAAPALAQGPARQARAERLRAMGRAYLAAGDPGSASGYFHDAIRVDPDGAEAYVALGRIYLDRGSLADALEVLAAGLRRRPDHAPLWRALAAALERRGALDDAADALREFTSRAPDDPSGHLARAELARRRGAWSEALASYRRVMDLAAAGADVPEASLTDARRYVSALALLTGDLDPVRGPGCDTASAVRQALAACPQLGDGSAQRNFGSAQRNFRSAPAR